MKKHYGNSVRRVSKRARWGALVATTALALTACGGGTSVPGAGSGSDSGSGSGAGSDLGKLRVIQSITRDLTMGGVEVAQLKGLYKGVNVEIITGQDVGQAMATGDVEIGVSAPTRVIGAIMNGLEATIVGPTIDAWDQYILASKNLGATRVEDLKGKTFGVSSFGSAGFYAIKKMASELGWSEKDYEIVTLGDINGLTAGLKNGTIDAFAWGSFAPFQLEAEGYADLLGSVQEFVGPAPLDVIAVSNSVLKERPEAVKAFCEGVYAANTALKDDPEDARKIFEDWGVSAAILPAALDAGLPLLSTSSEINDQMLSTLMEATKLTVKGAEKLDLETMKGMYKPCSEL